MNYKIDHCDPFDGEQCNYWMKLEHCGRYLFAADILAEAGASSVLDLSCAEGYGSDILASRGLIVAGGDIQDEYIANASRRYPSATFFRIDLDGEIPASLDGADAVVCFETLEHLKYPEAFLNRLPSLLRSGGTLLLSVPNKLYEKTDEDGKNCDPFHLHIFDKCEILNELTSRGFTVLGIYGQAVCNDMYAREHAAVKNGALTQEEADGLYKYDRESIIGMSRIAAYPTMENTDGSYSYIFVCRNG